MNAKTQEAMRDVKRTTEMVRIYNNLHDRRQDSVRLFAQSVFIQRTSEARFIDSPELDDFLWELCNVALLKANRICQFELTRACCQVLVFILPNKTR